MSSREGSWLNVLFFMKSLACLSTEYANDKAIKEHFKNETKKPKCDLKENPEILRFLHFALQFLAVLELIKRTEDGSRRFLVASVPSWYYGIYYAARAFIAAYNGSSPKDHSGTANNFSQNHIREKFLFPFNLSINVYSIEEDITTLLNEIGNIFKLDISYNTLKKCLTTARPNNKKEYILQILKYLEGTAKNIYEDKKQEYKKKYKIRRLSKKKEKEFADSQKATYVGFLHEAKRYREKIHYQEDKYATYKSEFLSENLKKDHAKELNECLYQTLFIFLKICLFYCSKRIGLEELDHEISENTPFIKLYNSLKIH